MIFHPLFAIIPSPFGFRHPPFRFRRIIDMMNLHDRFLFMNETIVTERGQVSVPANLRKSMGLHPGRKLHWEQVSDREIRVSVQDETPVGPLAVLGYARRIHTKPLRTTAEWMRELREGE